MKHRSFLSVVMVCSVLVLSGATAGYCTNALTMTQGNGCVTSNMDANDYIAVGVGRTHYLGGSNSAGSTVVVAKKESLIGYDGGSLEEICRCSGMPDGADVDERGCWVVAHFEFEKADITTASADRLDEAVGVLKNDPDLNIEIQGHSCSMGPLLYNQVLSEKRAKAVYDYLILQGINAPRMSYKGFAYKKPAASNETLSGRKLNRRVELQPIE
jgi:OOP family OmpA-OmpF porin